LELFLRKVFLLVSIRGQTLCGNLSLPSALFQQLWRVMIHILLNEAGLIRGRHVDQLLMCSLYGVCRINELSITFKSIIEKYSAQPQSASRIYRSVLINQADKSYGDIITFYNNIFIPIMQPYILQSHQSSPQQPTDPATQTTNTSILSPQNKPRLPNASFSSPIRIPHSPHHNLYVSPMSKNVAARVHTHTISAPLSRVSSTVPFSHSVFPSPTSSQPHGTTNPTTTPSLAHPPLQQSFTHTSHPPSSSSSVPSLISNTPRSTKLFSFGQSPAQELRQINTSINSPAPSHVTTTSSSPSSSSLSNKGISPAHRRTKRQLFEVEEDESGENTQPAKKISVEDAK